MATEAPAPEAADWGYLQNLEASYEFGRTLGRGGSGLVRVVRERVSGEEYACKSIRKDLRKDNRELVRREVRRRPHARCQELALRRRRVYYVQGPANIRELRHRQLR